MPYFFAKKWVLILLAGLAIFAIAGCENPSGASTSGDGDSDQESSEDPAPETFAVTYEGNGAESGTAPADSDEYEEGETVTVLGNSGTLARSDRTFSGWNLEADGSGTNYSEGNTFVMGSANVTLYARWVADDVDVFTVTFDSSGGSSVASQDIVDGETATEPDPPPSRTGHSLDGWFDGAAAWDFDDPITGDVTLTAEWTANDYDVAFDANGGSGSMAAQTITYDTQENLSANSFTRDGYTFEGWNTESDGSGTEYADEASFEMDVEGITLYAMWSEDGSDGVPSHVPSSSIGAIDGSAYDTLEFYFYGATGSSYNTDIYLYSDGSTTGLPILEVWFYDSSDSAAIDAGEYTMAETGAAGTFEEPVIVGMGDLDAGEIDYTAASLKQSELESATTWSISVYDQIVDGTIVVSESVGTYTFEWEFETAGGDTLSGSYTGAVDETFDES